MSSMSDIRKDIMARLGAIDSIGDRPGAKAKFMRFIDVLSWPGEHGSTYEAVISDDAGRFQPSVTRRDRDGSEQYLTRYAPTFKTEAGARKWLQAKIAEMKAQHRASRPGAKAKMQKWTVVMPSIPDAGTRHFDSWEQAKNYVDTKMGGFTALVSVDGKRYALKHALGQWEKFSRPGAKARMAIRSDNDIFDVLTEASDKGLDRHNLVREARRLRDAIDPHGVGGQAMLKHKSWPQLVRLAEQIERLPAAYARPGAKVTAGRAEDLYRKLSSGSITYANAKQWERLVTEALRLPDYTPPGGDMSLHEIAEDLGGDLMALKTHSGPVPHAKAKAEKASDLEREDVKAGLKVMAEADTAVSDKIRTLIAEGKPQEQAVAIALDMKRRGEI